MFCGEIVRMQCNYTMKIVGQDILFQLSPNLLFAESSTMHRSKKPNDVL